MCLYGENLGSSLLTIFFAHKFLEILKSLKRSHSALATGCDGARNPATLSALQVSAKRTFRIRERPKVGFLHLEGIKPFKGEMN
jgi:hypothetical protein